MFSVNMVRYILYGKRSEISNTSLFLKCWLAGLGFTQMNVRIANRADPDQIASSEEV